MQIIGEVERGLPAPGHAAARHIVCAALVAQHGGFFCAQGKDFVDDGLGVIVSCAAFVERMPHAAAQLLVFCKSQHRLH